MKPSIHVDHVSKHFKLPHEKHSGLKQAILSFRPGMKYELQHVLKDLTFRVNQGEFVGIVGRNGSGKSTLLKLLAQIYIPNKGHITINGTLTPFIELGVGFNPELTGRENVFLNGALLGFDRRQTLEMYDDIVSFAELERFMDQKLKNYSSGMQVRLAFSIAIRAKSDILLIDEVLAVGDAAFQRKCYDHFMSLKREKRTVVLVTHDMGAVRQYCDRAIMLEEGRIIEEGTPERVAQAYQRLFLQEDAAAAAALNNAEENSQPTDRWGTGKMKVTSAKVQLTPNEITIKAKFTAYNDLPGPILGFSIHGPSGVNLSEGNTQRLKKTIEPVKKGDKLEIEWRLPNIFTSGHYAVAVAACDQSATEYYDWLNDAAEFKISKEIQTAAVADPPITISSFNITKPGK